MSEELKGLLATLSMMLAAGAMAIGALVYTGQKSGVTIVVEQKACEAQQPQGGEDE